MIGRRWFIADVTLVNEDGTPYHSTFGRIMDSRMGNLLKCYLCSFTLLPLLLLYYDWLNGHHAAALYWQHIIPWLMKPLIGFYHALGWFLDQLLNAALFITPTIS